MFKEFTQEEIDELIRKNEELRSNLQKKVNKASSTKTAETELFAKQLEPLTKLLSAGEDDEKVTAIEVLQDIKTQTSTLDLINAELQTQGVDQRNIQLILEDIKDKQSDDEIIEALNENMSAMKANNLEMMNFQIMLVSKRPKLVESVKKPYVARREELEDEIEDLRERLYSLPEDEAEPMSELIEAKENELIEIKNFIREINIFTKTKKKTKPTIKAVEEEKNEEENAFQDLRETIKKKYGLRGLPDKDEFNDLDTTDEDLGDIPTGSIRLFTRSKKNLYLADDKLLLSDKSFTSPKVFSTDKSLLDMLLYKVTKEGGRVFVDMIEKASIDALKEYLEITSDMRFHDVALNMYGVTKHKGKDNKSGIASTYIPKRIYEDIAEKMETDPDNRETIWRDAHQEILEINPKAAEILQKLHNEENQRLDELKEEERRLEAETQRRIDEARAEAEKEFEATLDAMQEAHEEKIRQMQEKFEQKEKAFEDEKELLSEQQRKKRQKELDAMQAKLDKKIMEMDMKHQENMTEAQKKQQAKLADLSRPAEIAGLGLASNLGLQINPIHLQKGLLSVFDPKYDEWLYDSVKIGKSLQNRLMGLPAKLSKKDQGIFENLMQRSFGLVRGGGIVSNGMRIFHNFEDVKDRVALLLASIQAGNTNKKNKNELSQLMDFLLENKIVTNPIHKQVIELVFGI